MDTIQNALETIHEKREQVQEYRRKQLKKTLLSDEFLNFVEKNTAPFDTMIAYYRCAIMEVETKFKVLDEQFSLTYDANPIESIKSRIKSMDSLVRKIRDRNVPLTVEAIMENITDIAGVRVICSFPEDIYRLAESFVKQDDIKLLATKDYIKNPKPSGYRSLHLIVEVPIFLENEKRPMKVEVQFRTIAMDFWASLDHKLRYKKDLPPEKQKVLTEELCRCAQASAALDGRMQQIRDAISGDDWSECCMDAESIEI
ncbi:MAG: GTP pyrophosphokinase family protein [Lachnospiraceae bacterium]|nr:GTP pyrophosphokinase family protein [Lachnospiraceae bacterium]